MNLKVFVTCDLFFFTLVSHSENSETFQTDDLRSVNPEKFSCIYLDPRTYAL